MSDLDTYSSHRRFVLVLYFVCAGLGASLLLGTIAKGLFFRDSSPGPDRLVELSPEELLVCESDVRRLFQSLGEETCRLVNLPAKSDTPPQLGGRWEDFSRNWTAERYRIEQACMFQGLSGKKGAAFDRVAQVHKDLASMRLRYEALIVRFDEEQSGELTRMKRALDQSRDLLSKLLVPEN